MTILDLKEIQVGYYPKSEYLLRGINDKAIMTMTAT